MKLSAAFVFLACSSYALAAPISTVLGKVPSRANSLGVGLQQESRATLPIKALTRKPRKALENKRWETTPTHTRADGPPPPSRRLSLKSLKKPSRKAEPSYVVKLARRLKNKSPFSESSIVREETRASTEDWEPEATIVESETKASREAFIWIPSFLTDKKIHYRRVRVCTDMLVVSLALSIVAIILIIEMWKPVAARVRRFRAGHGPIYLDDIEVTSTEDWARKSCPSCALEPEAKDKSNLEVDRNEIVRTG